MRKPLVLALAAASLGGIALAAPASAACPTDLTCQATTLVAVPVVDAGVLAIAAAPVAVGGVPLGTTTTGSNGLPVISGSMALTTVTDTRLSSAGWSVTATAGTFTATLPATGTIPGSAASFTVPTAAATLGSPTLTYSATTPVASGGTLISASPASGSSVIGPNTVAYTPTINVAIPAGTGLSTYTGTVTQSVS
jgi:hypothetical protein